MRYVIALLLAIAVIIVVIIKLLSGGGGDSAVAPAPLADYANSSVKVRMTIDNPVQAPSLHREVAITVGRDITRFTAYKGFDQQIINDKRFGMTESAYYAFLRSLDITGDFTNGDTTEAHQNQVGYCALGNRYVYQIIDTDGSILQHFWSTDCGQKTFQGNINAVQDLFQNQVPNYGELISDLDL